jgi:NitT/TauT family transport system ATP-binding protein
MMIECKKLSKSFQTRNGVVHALEDVTFHVGEKELVCIVGPSGCGKTTLLRLIAGLLKPTAGKIVFQSAPDKHRPQNAMVFQEHGLFPWMTVLDNVAFGLEARGVGRKERRSLAGKFIEKLGLAPFAESYPYQLSVGMRQRAGIARAFLVNPQILLMDEPFGSLDAQTKKLLQEELLNIWRDQQVLILYVTHDIEEAVLLGDRVMVMTGRPGSILEVIQIPLDRPRDMFAREQSEIIETKWHIWKMLRDEVRKSLWITE